MKKAWFLSAFFAFALQASQAQMFSHGVPASATSPEPDGRQHGIPASVVSPTQLPFGVNPPLRNRPVRVQGPLRRFGTPAHHGRPIFVPVPLFYSYYTDGYPSIADPSVPEAPVDPAAAQQASDSSQPPSGRDDEALRDAYLQGARDALRQEESRYGEHYMDSRERAPRKAPASQPKRSEDTASSTSPAEDKSPATVFIFKDGHQLETRNYAIMGQTLFDFSGKTLKKIQMDEIDAAATSKANDDRGVQVKVN